MLFALHIAISMLGLDIVNRGDQIMLNTYGDHTSYNESTDTATMSFWLRDALESAKQRDPVDAINDAEYLLLTLKEFYGIK